jgi:hypothetical protein
MSRTVGLSDAFRGSHAIAAGLTTPRILRGPRYRRLFPDIYAPTDLEPDLALRSRAAYLLVEGRGVLAGYSAAEVMGASCAPPDAPATVLMLTGRQRRPSPGLVVRRDLLYPGEITRIGVSLLTAPVRTAFDLARWAPNLTEKVVAVDTLAHQCGFRPQAVQTLRSDHLGARGSRDLLRVLQLVDARSESPMESRIRLALVLGNLPAPAVQHPVTGHGRSFRLDLAYPEVRLAVEYDGGEHRTPERARRDLAREAVLTQLGWTILRFAAGTVLYRPTQVVAKVRAELQRRGVTTGSVHSAPDDPACTLPRITPGGRRSAPSRRRV